MSRLVRRSSTAPAKAWWNAVQTRIGAAPWVVQELYESASVAADPLEIQQAVGWARVHPAWRDDGPPFMAQ
jgi:hypothetical protein